MRGRTARNSSETCAELVGDLRGHFQKIPENSRKIRIARNSCSAIFFPRSQLIWTDLSGEHELLPGLPLIQIISIGPETYSFRFECVLVFVWVFCFGFSFGFSFGFGFGFGFFLFFCFFVFLSVFFFNTKFSNLISLYKVSIFGRLCALFGVPLAPNHIVCLSLINLYSLDSWHYRALCQEILWRLVNILYFPQIFKDGGTKIPLSAYYAFLLWLELLWLE